MGNSSNCADLRRGMGCMGVPDTKVHHTNNRGRFGGTIIVVSTPCARYPMIVYMCADQAGVICINYVATLLHNGICHVPIVQRWAPRIERVKHHARYSL